MRDGISINLRLNREDFDALLLVLGYATGAAIGRGDPQYAYSILDLANRINRHNRDWKPYEIPEEYRRASQTPNDANAKGDRSSAILRGKRKPGPTIQ